MSSKQKKDSVIIIKAINFSEADKILTVYGRNSGKFSIIAKGVRKINSKNRPAIQTLSISEISYFEGKNLGVLKEAVIIKEIITESNQLDEAKRILIIFNKLLPENDPDNEIFSLIYNFSLDVEDKVKATNSLIIKILQKLGYIDSFQNCTSCGKLFDKNEIRLLQKDDLHFFCTNCAKENRNNLNLKDISSFEFASILDNYIEKLI